MYIETATQQLRTEREIRELFPNVSFPMPFAPPAGYAYVFPAPAPAYDPATQFLMPGAPVLTGLGHWEHTWSVVALAPERIAELAAAAAAAARQAAKAARELTVAGIKVTTGNGWEWDGDEVSQGRMVRAIIAMQATSTPTVNWVLADNTVVQATAAQLTEALAMAGASQAAAWVLP